MESLVDSAEEKQGAGLSLIKKNRVIVASCLPNPKNNKDANAGVTESSLIISVYALF